MEATHKEASILKNVLIKTISASNKKAGKLFGLTRSFLALQQAGGAGQILACEHWYISTLIFKAIEI